MELSSKTLTMLYIVKQKDEAAYVKGATSCESSIMKLVIIVISCLQGEDVAG